MSCMLCLPFIKIIIHANDVLNMYRVTEIVMGGSTKSQKAGRLKRLEAKIVKKPASYRDNVET